MSLSYWQQLQHPKWQEKRLRVFERANFKCEQCGGGDETLHAHHKRYIKGRMAWEYDDGNFAALCATCHEDVHASKERFGAIIEALSPMAYQALGQLSTGFLSKWLPDEVSDPYQDSRYAAIGRLAGLLNNYLSDEEIQEVAREVCDRLEAKSMASRARRQDETALS